MKKITVFLVTLLLIASCGQKETEKVEEVKPVVEKETVVEVEEKQEENLDKVIFTVQIGAFTKQNYRLSEVRDVEIFIEDNLYKYRVGAFDTYEMARSYKRSLLEYYPDAFIQAMRNGQTIGIGEALAIK